MDGGEAARITGEIKIKSKKRVNETKMEGGRQGGRRRRTGREREGEKNSSWEMKKKKRSHSYSIFD